MAPRIFMFLRSPVTGTSGGHPTPLPVAWMVESCRKLAWSVKMSVQFRERAFFNGRIDAPVPSVLRRGIGARQHAMRAWHAPPDCSGRSFHDAFGSGERNDLGWADWVPFLCPAMGGSK